MLDLLLLTRKSLTLLQTPATYPSSCLNTNVMARGGGALRSKRATEKLVTHYWALSPSALTQGDTRDLLAIPDSCAIAEKPLRSEVKSTGLSG